ncbi:DUF3592 domain-containing protein [Amycolatopsis rhabdoformis]|uniref:DUF3592 domain-containing protein n=1 Tax=Amycolatopsis rhabdoformis TaxID=1448059 RepID=A0ABZ1I9Q8_9PSEU|nr:DUF3592 domain-containing protein [Amycolatopsis rhabdoformis]WSE30647.1 DUF3592 domain-containing protein [Amycolatopsis rhabdoformis]
MDLGTAGDRPDSQDDEPLLARTGRPTRPDPVTLDRAVRSRIRRAVLAAVAWTLLLVATIAGVVLLFRSSERLLVEGVRTTARVDMVVDNSEVRGARSYFVVAYGERRAAIFDVDSTSHHVGETLTVYYDPDDPLHVRTADNANGDDLWFGGSVIVALVELVPLAWAVVFPVRLARRRRLAARSGWRRVKITPFGSRAFIVRHADGERLVVRIVTVLRRRYRFLAQAPRRGWVGGRGKHLVLVVPRGTDRCAIPVHAFDHIGENSRGTTK